MRQLSHSGRFRHREGMGDLHQYVIEEDPIRAPKPTPVVHRGPKVINLDDRPPAIPTTKPKWSGPPNIAIYLSSIELPDLKPRPKPPKNVPHPQLQAQSHPQTQIRPVNSQARPPAPTSVPNKIVRPPPPPPVPQQQQQHPGPPRMNGPGGSIPNGHALRPPPPTEEDRQRRSSFGRLFGR